ncbi:MAG: NAD(+) diphosphatase [Acidobacteriota bacterium]
MDRPYPIRNILTGGRLDRAHQRRSDAAWLRARRRDGTSRILPVWRSQPLIQRGDPPRAGSVSPSWAYRLVGDGATWVFLGLLDDVPWFTLDLSHLERPPATLLKGGRFVSLRDVGPLLESSEASIVTFACGISNWHRANRFCSTCGHGTRVSEGGHQRVCTQSGCGRSHFPRTDPAVIVLVHDGADRCLLVHQPEFRPKVYSTLAGFTEPGESLEETVVREVQEETGVVVSAPRYHSSQPWPFPSSMMVGFMARALRTELDLDPREIADARWFSRSELRAAVAADEIRLPSPVSIAYRLVSDWLEGGDGPRREPRVSRSASA